MKYLSDYTEKATTKLFNKHHAFFAFSDKQFEEGAKKEFKPYVHLFGGLIAPKATADQLCKDLKNITKEGIKQDIKENGIENIIKRELSNHEAYYTGEIEQTVDGLAGYSITNEKIMEVFTRQKQTTNHFA